MKEETKQKARDYANSLVIKQETLEEVKANSYIDFAKSNEDVSMYSFVAGWDRAIKWQQEQDKNKFSEEDIMKAVKFGELYRSEGSKSLFEKKGTTPTEVLKKWIEQLKNR
jgi:hypothetical protein